MPYDPGKIVYIFRVAAISVATLVAVVAGAFAVQWFMNLLAE